MRVETSLKHLEIINVVCCITEPSSIQISIMLIGVGVEKQSSQREMRDPFTGSEAPNKNGSWNQGTPPSRHVFWNEGADVDRRRSAIGEAMREPQLRHKG